MHTDFHIYLFTFLILTLFTIFFSELQMDNIFHVGQEHIVPLYDCVYLQKGMINNLLEKDLLLAKNSKLSECKSQCGS